MLKINGSAMDNHPHSPLFCAAVADRLIQLLTLVLIRRMAHMFLSEQRHYYTHTQQMHISQSSSHSPTLKYTKHVNKAHQAVLCCNQESQVFSMTEAHTLWKQPSLNSISSCCFPRHLHYPPLCCRSLALLLAYPHFVAIIHYGLAFWHACKLANYRMASCH